MLLLEPAFKDTFLWHSLESLSSCDKGSDSSPGLRHTARHMTTTRRDLITGRLLTSVWIIRRRGEELGFP